MHMMIFVVYCCSIFELVVASQLPGIESVILKYIKQGTQGLSIKMGNKTMELWNKR